MATLTISVDASPLLAALASLTELLERALQLGEPAVHAVKPIAQALRVDGDRLAASRTADGRIVFEPSDRLRELVAAGRALQLDGVAVEKAHLRSLGPPA